MSPLPLSFLPPASLLRSFLPVSRTSLHLLRVSPPAPPHIHQCCLLRQPSIPLPNLPSTYHFSTFESNSDVITCICWCPPPTLSLTSGSTVSRSPRCPDTLILTPDCLNSGYYLSTECPPVIFALVYMSASTSHRIYDLPQLQPEFLTPPPHHHHPSRRHRTSERR